MCCARRLLNALNPGTSNHDDGQTVNEKPG